MARLVVPSILGINTEGMPFGTVVFMQAVQDALNTLDNNVIYKDAVTQEISAPRIRASSAQGQAFSVAGVSLASGDDYAALVSDFQALVQGYVTLVQEVTALKNQIKGS